MAGTFWAFVPAIVAIVLALVTKQVYVSLFLGIFVGALFYAGGNPLEALGTLFSVMSEKVGGNASIIVFLVVLGIFVILLQKSGGSKAYGDWASKAIKSKSGALAATAGLGALIFVDDYFNCLTVGSVMRPVTDKFKVSHSKLAYIIDSTAAPICIIAPISSWAAAATGDFEGNNAILYFIKTIPFNVYALLTIAFVFVLCFLKLDFGKMRKNEIIAEKTGDLNAGEKDLPTDDIKVEVNPRGRVRHLIVPVVVLIACCIGAMIYSGYFYDWDAEAYGKVPQCDNVIQAFSNCDAGSALAIGSTIALVIVSVFYMIEKVVSFKEITESFTQGFKAMVPAILILTFAWTISGIMGSRGGYLDAQAFVENNLANIPSSLSAMLPAIFFILAAAIAFATGTSWGTFGILIPIGTTILGSIDSSLALLTISATLGGAVVGDHISPISDTTILASTGANCNHVDHVKTQLPYALVTAGVAFVVYLVSGFIAQSVKYGVAVVLVLLIAVVLFAAVLAAIYFFTKHKDKELAVEHTETASQDVIEV